MKGGFSLRLELEKVIYNFYIRRNITLIRGNSGTGKSTFVNGIELLLAEGNMSRLQCKYNVAVLPQQENLGVLLVKTVVDTVFVCDEDNRYIAHKEFAGALRDSGNFLICVSRRDYKTLPYSIHEIYEIKTSNKYINGRQIYENTLMSVNRIEYDGVRRNIDVIITEDKKSGFQFFDNQFKGVVSAEGNGGVCLKIQEVGKDVDILVFVDGAAFGSQITGVRKLMSNGYRVLLWAPESFEYLILKTELIGVKDLGKILGDPMKYIDSREYFTWERYFTGLLERATVNSVLAYKKDKLNNAYYSKKYSSAILKDIRDKVYFKQK